MSAPMIPALMAANAPAMPDPFPDLQCGSCRYWGESVGSRRAFPPLGLCYVRPGAIPVYSAPKSGCSVRAQGNLLWRPIAGKA